MTTAFSVFAVLHGLGWLAVTLFAARAAAVSRTAWICLMASVVCDILATGVALLGPAATSIRQIYGPMLSDLVSTGSMLLVIPLQLAAIGLLISGFRLATRAAEQLQRPSHYYLNELETAEQERSR